jgi:peptidyl-Asp metalloendopeptidase
MRIEARIAGVAFACTLAGSAFAQASQQLLRGATPASLQRIQQANTQWGATELRGLTAAPGDIVFSVPDANKAAWLEQLKTINTGGAPPIGVTSLAGDYRALFHRLPTTSGLTPIQENKLASLRATFGADKVNLVTLAPKPLVHEAVTIGFDIKDGFTKPGTLSLPLETGRDLSLTQEVRTPTDGGYLWRGKPAQSVSATDEASFISSGESMTGTVRVGREIFTYLPLGNGVHAVTKQGTTGGPAEHPPRMLEMLKSQSSKDAPPTSPVDIAEQAVIDVLLVFTRKSVDGLAAQATNALAALAMEDANRSLRDSGIPSARLRLAHVHTTAYDEAGPWNDHLRFLAASMRPAFKTIRQLRDLHKADVVVLVVQDDRFCGDSHEIGAGANQAFAVVSRTCLLAPHYSLAHELGHLLGARHDRKTDPDGIRWAHGYVDSQERWRTLMSYDVCNGCPRILRWSNPNMPHESEPTGTSDFEYDARVWVDYAKRASKFR